MKKEMMSKFANQERIFHLIREKGELTKQEIAALLNISMPTVLHNIDAMMKAGILSEAGTNESTGGRKAMKLSLNPDAAYGIGIDLALHHVEIIVTDLLGHIVCSKIVPTRFKDQIDWYFNLDEELSTLLKEQNIATDKIIGCGISFPGIVDEEAGYLVKSHILDMEHINLDRFKRVIPFPLVVANDANCACVAERTPDQHTYLYISLNESVGGAFMSNNELYLGNTFQTGEIGHMILYPEGKECYCGKKGCADPYLSPLAFLKDGDNIEDFFNAVAQGDIEKQAVLTEYINNLSIFISNLRMLLNVDIVLGGEVGKYIESYLPLLERRVGKYDLFARDVDYIIPCKTKTSICAKGAALLALERYSENLLN